jgi:hypothetical protein
MAKSNSERVRRVRRLGTFREAEEHADHFLYLLL